jgi:CubicO group peptidase (beta-lactamase class C family)
MNHTSGLPFTSAIETPKLDMLSLNHLTHSYAMTPLLSEPGSKYCYSNAGTNTVGRIIEVVSGMSYEDFMDKRLFHPLGMTETTFWPSREQISRLAKVYQVKEDKSGLFEIPMPQLSPKFHDRRRRPMPAGGLFSVAADPVKFCQMLLNGGTFKNRHYLSKASVKEMTTKQTGDHLENPYGYGMGTENGNFGHGGALKTNMTVHRKLGLITVLHIHHLGDWPEEGKTLMPTFFDAAKKLFR